MSFPTTVRFTEDTSNAVKGYRDRLEKLGITMSISDITNIAVKEYVLKQMERLDKVE